MKRDYPAVPVVGVGAIIIEEGKVALVRRGQPPRAGEWSIPGGKLEIGETLRQATAREALEETGLTVEVRELLGVFDRILLDDVGRIQYHYVLIDFLCRRTNGDLQAGDDASEVRWFTERQSSELFLMEDTGKVIKSGFEKATP